MSRLRFFSKATAQALFKSSTFALLLRDRQERSGDVFKIVGQLSAVEEFWDELEVGSVGVFDGDPVPS